MPIFAIWDDHDFGDNDDYGTPALDSPQWKVDALALFQKQWVNPGYGDEGKWPGLFFKHNIGSVDFFFLDCRYYREVSEEGQSYPTGRTMLGSQQLAWLQRELLQSKADFKVLISSVPWALEAKPPLEGKRDTWPGI
ncbi:MAG: hypothetical protein HC842_04850 [Cytophagales bacterium]|nr:hypothetical protein [Cytophagales bacterium]